MQQFFPAFPFILLFLVSIKGRVMHKLILFFILCMGKSMAGHTLYAQNSSDSDLALKHVLYTQYKKEVLAYDKRHDDKLFFFSFEKQNNPSIILTKEGYYTYTIKIAIYSEKWECSSMTKKKRRNRSSVCGLINVIKSISNPKNNL